MKSGKVPDVNIVSAQKNYKKALEKGVLKILSKVRMLGLTTLVSVHIILFVDS